MSYAIAAIARNALREPSLLSNPYCTLTTLESEVSPEDPTALELEVSPDEAVLLCTSSSEKVDSSCDCKDRSVWKTLLIVSCVVLGIVFLVIVGYYTIRRLSKSGEGMSPLV